MAASYDELEPWYEHLYAVLHGLVRTELPRPATRGSVRALDAGCGTGFQTAILLALGYRTVGIDLSGGLLAVARRRHPAASFVRGDLQALPWPDATFDVAVSVGSTLSFVEHPARAFREIGRVLRPGGRVLLEVEHRYSLDLVWQLLSSAVGDPLRYGASLAEAARAFARPFGGSIVGDYPGYPRLRLFARRDLDRLLREAGLIQVRAWGLHSVTNVIPSTVLHRPRLGRAMDALYRGLCALDRVLASSRAAHALANSLVVLAVRPTDREMPRVDERAPRGRAGE
jgi:SAM-dependent methyltransferase